MYTPFKIHKIKKTDVITALNLLVELKWQLSSSHHYALVTADYILVQFLYRHFPSQML